METKAISVREDVYERLAARKREDESLNDLIEGLLDDTKADWREGFGTLSEEEGDELEAFVRSSRHDL